MAESKSTSVIVPAYNEASAIGEVVSSLTAIAEWCEIIVVDDGSSDDTAARARAAGAVVVQHPYNKGNGSSIKTGIRQAIGEYILIVDGDGQHRAEDAVRLVTELGKFDLVIGARAGSMQAGIMRRIGNALLNRLASYLTGRPIPDLTSGLRAARRIYLRDFLHLLPRGFSTPTTTTLAFIKAGYNVTFVPIKAQARTGQSKIRLASDGVKFFLILLRVITIFSPLRFFLPMSMVTLILGAGYAIWTIVTQSHVTNSSVLLIVLGVIIFLIGLVSEQISALRFESKE